jgi:uncharacterized protein
MTSAGDASNPPSNALVTGATGLLGPRLVGRLERARVLSRDPARAKRALGDVDAFAWDTARGVPAEALEGVRAVFHLAGESVAPTRGRWSDERKGRIRASRVEGTRRLVEAIRAAKDRPRVLVSASAVGYYGSRGDAELTEESAPGDGFLAGVCRAWEDEARGAEALGVRVVLARIGVVLAKDGGALGAMLPVFRLGLGGPLGDGTQYVPWIHVDDVIGLLLHAAAEEAIRGPMNVCAPHAVTNAELSRELARALHRPSIFRAPATALRLALGDMADVVLGSQRVVPTVAARTGYVYRHPELSGALRAALDGGPTR